MAYVAGENGVYIQELMDKSNEEFDKGNLDESVFYWNKHGKSSLMIK